MITLRLDNPRTETIAELYAVGDLLCLKFAQRDDVLRDIAYNLNLRWNAEEWRRERQITLRNGPLPDRLIEAAYKLLSKGFVVAVPDEYDVERIAAGQYQDEQTRWVTKLTKGARAGWFYIEYKRGDDMYRHAIKLPGAKYDKPCVAVPPESYEAVLDFAQMHGFRVSDAAQQVAQDARQRRLQAVRVELRPRVKAVLVVESVPEGIAPEFLDED